MGMTKTRKGFPEPTVTPTAQEATEADELDELLLKALPSHIDHTRFEQDLCRPSAHYDGA